MPTGAAGARAPAGRRTQHHHRHARRRAGGAPAQRPGRAAAPDGSLAFQRHAARGSLRHRRDALVYGDGDGFGVAALVGVPAQRAGWPTTARCSCLPAMFAPRACTTASRRARIAMRPSTWRSFANGVIAYQAGFAGQVTRHGAARSRPGGGEPGGHDGWRLRTAANPALAATRRLRRADCTDNFGRRCSGGAGADRHPTAARPRIGSTCGRRCRGGWRWRWRRRLGDRGRPLRAAQRSPCRLPSDLLVVQPRRIRPPNLSRLGHARLRADGVPCRR